MINVVAIATNATCSRTSPHDKLFSLQKFADEHNSTVMNLIPSKNVQTKELPIVYSEIYTVSLILSIKFGVTIAHV